MGIDDSPMNFAELFGGDPRPFLLLPFYTYLDLMCLAGYDPATYAVVQEVWAELRPKLVAENEERKRLSGKRDVASSHPGFEKHEFVLAGAALNLLLLAAEVFFGGTSAEPTWIIRLLIGANAIGIMDFAWNKGLRYPLAHLSAYGSHFQDERLARWCMWYLGCFGLCGAAAAAVGPARAPLGVFIMGFEKAGFVSLFISDLGGPLPKGVHPSERVAMRNLLIYDTCSCFTMVTYGAWLMTAR